MVSDEEFTELEYRLKWAEEERDEALAHARNLQDETEQLKERIVDLHLEANEQIGGLGIEIEELMQIQAELEGRIALLQAEVEERQGCCQKALNQITELTAERDTLKDLLGKYRCENECLAARDGRMQQLQCDLETASTLIAGLKSDLTAANAELREARR